MDSSLRSNAERGIQKSRNLGFFQNNKGRFRPCLIYDMKNFLILTFIFFLPFLLVAFLAPDPMFIFFFIYLGMVISLGCLLMYLGWLRSLIIVMAYFILPFLLEYLFNVWKIPFFNTSTIIYLSTRTINLPVTAANLITIFSIPTLLICSLFFSQKIKLLLNIKHLPKTFLIVTASLLLALNFLNLKMQNLDFGPAIRWFILGLVINIMIAKLIKFKIEIPDFFKEMPIILWLLFFSFNYVTTANYLFLIIGAAFLIIYLVALYNDHQYRKLSQNAGL
jgi:hypothetical protein